jgi:hypothetical protein
VENTVFEEVSSLNQLTSCTVDQLLAGFHNDTSQKYSCYPLLARGPCDEGHWFLASPPSDDNSLEATVAGECKERPCRDNSQILYRDQCIRVGTSSVCQRGMELLPNIFGEGEFLTWRESLVAYFYALLFLNKRT